MADEVEAARAANVPNVRSDVAHLRLAQGRQRSRKSHLQRACGSRRVRGQGDHDDASEPQLRWHERVAVGQHFLAP